MAYQALARKWRPGKFQEIVGQDHVVRALTHALQFDRLHHAYLFTGTRGVGKTTVARILAKALNCQTRKEAEPCGTCSQCQEFDESRYVDLIEVDAASRTRVEDTRDLMENVLYAPSQGRYKVYLIDEVHMLSTHSFNALLKTLEEPPPHVKFLLATTDPQKIPVTVLSRCLQFNLKRLTPVQISGQLEIILHQEAVTFEINAVRLLARAADGSLRDGLSLMDQAILHGGGSLDEATVAIMLGTVARQPIFELLDAVIRSDAAVMLDLIEVMDQYAPNYPDVLQQLLIILHHAALGQWSPEAVRRDDDAEQLLDISRKLSAEDLQLLYQIGLIGQRDLPLAPDPRMGFEMVLLRMLAFRPVADSGVPASDTKKNLGSVRPGSVAKINTSDARSQASGSEPESQKKHSIAEPVSGQKQHPTSVPPATSPSASSSLPVEEGSPPSLVDHSDWPTLIRAMELTAMTRELANNCVMVVLNESGCELSLEPKLIHLRSPRAVGGLERALSDYFNRPVKLQIHMVAATAETPASRNQREKEELQREAEDAIEQDEFVQSLQAKFDARIVPGTVKPVK
jgi:DNA polymerase-3 subunit gamma/tau